jgi:hypothetical protein
MSAHLPPRRAREHRADVARSAAARRGDALRICDKPIVDCARPLKIAGGAGDDSVGSLLDDAIGRDESGRLGEQRAFFARKRRDLSAARMDIDHAIARRDAAYDLSAAFAPATPFESDDLGVIDRVAHQLRGAVSGPFGSKRTAPEGVGKGRGRDPDLGRLGRVDLHDGANFVCAPVAVIGKGERTGAGGERADTKGSYRSRRFQEVATVEHGLPPPEDVGLMAND